MHVSFGLQPRSMHASHITQNCSRVKHVARAPCTELLKIVNTHAATSEVVMHEHFSSRL